MTGSSVSAGFGGSGSSRGIAGFNPAFASARIIDGGSGGTNALLLKQEIGGPASGSLSFSNYINFSSVEIQSGSWSLSGSSSASSVLLSGDTAIIDNPSAFGSAHITSNGGTLATSTSLALTNDMIISSGGLSLEGTNNLTLSGTLSGSGSVIKTGAITVTLTGANTYTGGTTVNAGRLALGAGGSLAATGAVTLSGAGAVFDISASAANQTIGALSGVVGSTVALERFRRTLNRL